MGAFIYYLFMILIIYIICDKTMSNKKNKRVKIPYNIQKDLYMVKKCIIDKIKKDYIISIYK